MATGPIGMNDSRAHLAAQRRAQEAARKAAEEAARKRAEEAARKAAEEARKKAAEEAQKKAAEAARKKAAEEAQKRAAAERLEKADKSDKVEGKGAADGPAKADAVEALTNRGLNKAIKKPVEPIKPDEAKIEQKGIKDGISKAKTSEDVKKVAERSKTLNERLKVTDDPRIDKQMRKDVAKTDAEIQKADKAVTKLETSKKALEGKPEERAAETARLLANPDEVKGAIKDLKALKDSPVAETLKKDVKAIAEKADPEALKQQLEKEPDLKKYAPEMGGSLAKLRQLDDPKLNAAIDKATAKESAKTEKTEKAEKPEEKGFFGKVGDFFGDVASDTAKIVDKGVNLVGEGVGFVGKTAGKAVDLLGDGIDFVADTAGKAHSTVIKGTGHLVGEGLEALGAESLGKSVKDNSKAAAKLVEDAADKVGNVANSFVDGVGGALSGTADGVQFIIQEPVQAAKGFYTIGKAAVTGDTDTLKAVGKAMVDEAFVNPSTGKFDIAYGTGYIAANVVPMLATGGGSTAATGANASSKMAKVGAFAARADQVMDGARALQSLDVAGVVNTAKALKAPLAAGDDIARLARTKAFLKNPKNYAQNYASHLKGNALVAKGTLRQNIQNLKASATNAIQNPGQVASDLVQQTASNAKKSQLTGKLAAKSVYRGIKNRDFAQFEKAVEFMNKNPLVQGLNNGMNRATAIADTINNPLKPLNDRFGTMVNNNIGSYTRAGQGGVEAALDVSQMVDQEKKLQEASK